MNILSPNTPSSLSAKSLSTRKICRNKTTNNCYMHSCYDVVIRVVMKVERCCGVDRSNKQVCFLLPVTIAASGIKTVCRQSCYTEHKSQKRVLTPPPLSPNLQPDAATVRWYTTGGRRENKHHSGLLPSSQINGILTASQPLLQQLQLQVPIHKSAHRHPTSTDAHNYLPIRNKRDLPQQPLDMVAFCQKLKKIRLWKCIVHLLSVGACARAYQKPEANLLHRTPPVKEIIQGN